MALGCFYFPLIGTPTAEGNQLWFYEAGLDKPLNVWTDVDGLIAWAQPIVLNAAGEADGPIYVSPSPAYKVVYQDSDDVPIAGYPVDFVSPSTIVNVMTTVIKTLTNAEFKALPTTGITVKTAPASGLRVKILGASALFNHTAGAYTNVNATYCTLQLEVNSQLAAYPIVVNDSTTTPPMSQATAALGAVDRLVNIVPLDYLSAITGYVVVGSATAAGVNPSNWEAMAILLKADNNGSGNFTGGHANNTCTVTLYYALEPV